MDGRGMNRIVDWLRACRAARRLRDGIGQREALLRKVGRAAATPGQRLPLGTWQAHGEAIYRRFKWDAEQVPAEARVLCRQLALLESHLSRLVRQIGPAHNAAAAARAPVLLAGITR